MRITIHQPEHFPYLGFFQKMQNADLFVILDDVKFKKNDFQNRNRFINRSKTEEWFTVPVEGSSNSKLIHDVIVSSDISWRKKIKKQIYFNTSIDVSSIYDDSDKLIDINMKSIDWCRKKMNIATPMIFSSTLEIEGSKSELLCNICKKLGATKYLSGSGGKDYLNIDLFKNNNIRIDFFEPNVPNMMSALYNLK